MASISLLADLLTSFLITYAVIPSIVAISNEKKLFDVPNRRKLNKVVVPTLGGVAIFVGVVLSSILFLRNYSIPEWQYLFAAIILMLFTGLTDDLLVIAAWKKASIQLGAALILVLLGGFQVTQAYGLFSVSTFSSWFSIPLSIIIIIFLINAINLIDGIDGLAGGLSMLVSFALGTWFYLTGNTGYAVICAALSGSLAAFLCFNIPNRRNKIFMGDTGSLVLGTFMAAIAIRFNELNAVAEAPFRFSQAPLLPMALLIVPATDTLRVFTIRILKKGSPFSPDRNHIHHLLIKAGLTHVQATCFLLIYTLFFTLVALSFAYFRLNITAGFVLLFTLSFAAVQAIYKITKFRIKRRAYSHLENIHIRSNHRVNNRYARKGNAPVHVKD